MFSIVLLVGSGFLAGSLNAVAGGGTFLTLPTLVYLGLPPIVANATSTVAVLPGYISSAMAFRGHIGPAAGVGLPGLMVASLLGGIAGACLLLVTPSAVFRGIVPWLLLLATVLFAVGPSLLAQLRARRPVEAGPFAALAVVFLISLYGGYFNGGLGILLLAGFGLLGLDDLNRMNGLKNLLSAGLSVISSLTFAVAGIVSWHETAIMAVAATLGGYWGGRLAQRVSPSLLRASIVVTGLVMAVLFFIQ